MHTPQPGDRRRWRLGWPAWTAIIGLVCACAAFAASRYAASQEWVSWAAVLAAVFLAAVATSGRPSSSGILAVAGLTALVASGSIIDPSGTHTGWDSVVLVLRILAVVAWLAALVVRLPASIQRVAVSAVILFHGGAVICGALSAPPAPWLVWAIQERVYHRYLNFLNLTNAYRFYAPEFGTSTLLWFRIEYESDDGRRRHRWVRVPDFDHNQVPRRDDGEELWPPIRYFRRLCLSDGLYFMAGHCTPEQIEARVRAGQLRGIPLHPTMPLMSQYAPLVDRAWPTMRSYVRHVARTCRHPERPELDVDSIKVYRCVHFATDPGGILNGWDLSDPVRMAAYYLGAFDEEGRDLPYFDRTPEGVLVAGRDPFRFWAIPILRRDGTGMIVGPSRPRSADERYDVHDSTLGHGELEVHRP